MLVLKKFGTTTTRATTLLWDALFPRFCVGCGREGRILCTTCHETWAPDGGVDNCRKLSFAQEDGLQESMWFLAHYADPVARGLLTTWKYHFDESAWATLARRLQPSLTLLHLRAAMADIEAVVPVPLSRERCAERGFDQAAIIAEWIAAGIHRPVLHLLERKFTTGHQAERSISERKRAMAASPFFVRKDVQELSQRILLVDDVWTTGATMQAAARVLTAAGVTHIQPMTILKG